MNSLIALGYLHFYNIKNSEMFFKIQKNMFDKGFLWCNSKDRIVVPYLTTAPQVLLVNKREKLLGSSIREEDKEGLIELKIEDQIEFDFE